MVAIGIWGRAADRFESGQVHRYRDPLELGATIDPPRMSHQKPAGVWRSPALELVVAKLKQLADADDGRNLMIFIPPQEGKTSTVARWFPTWLLSDDPSLNIAVVSYARHLAVRSSRFVRRTLETNPQLGVVVRRDSRAMDRWETTAGGGMIAVGIAGGISGNPVDVLIIDDPVAGRAEAESKVYRDRAWDWYESNGFPRLSGRGRVVLMMTRYHTDDLAGRILREEPSDWDVLSIPAIAEPGFVDPLGREPGEELQSVQQRKSGWFERLQKLRSPYVWQSVYQQRPTAAEGNLFKRDAWRYWKRAAAPGGVALDLDGMSWALRDCYRFMTVDLATSTKSRADFTVGCAWAITPNQDLILLGRFRDRVAEADHFDRLRPLMELWLSPGDLVHVEASQHSTTIAYEAGRAGIPVAKLDADKDKLTRAIPAANRQRQGRIWLPRDAPWLDEWLDEHADFPSAAHDDQVDNTAYAERVSVAKYVAPQEIAPLAYAARSSYDLDIMGVEY